MTSGDTDPPFADDPGLAADRTTLAWRRSGVSMVAIGLAVARGIPTVDAVPSRPVLGLVIVGLGTLSFLASSRQAGRRAAHRGVSRPIAVLGDLWPVTAATLAAAIGAILVVLVA